MIRSLEELFTRLEALWRKYDIDSLDNRDPELIDKLSRWLGGLLMLYFRAEVRGMERIPSGPGLYVGNHNSGGINPDTYILFCEIYRVHGLEALPYGLGHETVLRLPGFHHFFIPMGAIRASHDNAHRLFACNKKVLVYPGGDLEDFRPFRHRNRIVFGGRRGYVRLALREDVPIIPVVAAGAHSTFLVLDDMRWLALRMPRFFRTRVWPLTLSIPWGLTLGPLPVHFPWPSRILIEVLEPIRFDRAGLEAARDDSYVCECAERVESTMQGALDRLVTERARGG